MNLLDSNCWILEPLKPTKTDFYRRISLNPNVSIKVLVDPRNPREIPQITFLGSEDSNKTVAVVGTFKKVNRY
jgi:hypothetical protein